MAKKIHAPSTRLKTTNWRATRTHKTHATTMRHHARRATSTNQYPECAACVPPITHRPLEREYQLAPSGGVACQPIAPQAKTPKANSSHTHTHTHKARRQCAYILSLSYYFPPLLSTFISVPLPSYDHPLSTSSSSYIQRPMGMDGWGENGAPLSVL